jgi:plastocyanin
MDAHLAKTRLLKPVPVCWPDCMPLGKSIRGGKWKFANGAKCVKPECIHAHQVSMPRSTVFSVVVFLLAGLAVIPTRGATSIVAMRNFTFAPSNLVVRPGDSVLWSNAVSMPTHDTSQGVSNTPTALRLWASAELSFQQTFRFTFTNSGDYPYICYQHVVVTPQGDPPTQTGLVRVTTMQFPPTVQIVSPTNNAVSLNRASVNVTTAPGDVDGTVRKVQLFLGANLVGTATNTPFNFTTPSLFAGTYTLTARVTDNDGLMGTSAPVNIIIRPRTNTVTLANFSFTPATLPNETVGDTVIFNNTSPSLHTATGDTSTEPLCGAALIPASTTCLVVLTNAGIFPYHCTIHPPPSFSMTGLVVVAGPPIVSITSPTNSEALPELGDFTISADATKLGGTVTNVEFYANGVLLGNDVTSPFSVVASNLPAGNYTLTARAVDNSGYSGFANLASVSVGTPLRLFSPLIASDMFQFDLSTSPGQTYVIESSPVLPPNWSPVQTNLATGAVLRIIEPFTSAVETQIFYRAFLQP